MAGGAGKLLILAVAMMVVMTQACPRISVEPCRLHLLGQGSIYGCCRVLAIMYTPHCQCSVVKGFANAHPDVVDREYALNLPVKCGTMHRSCPDKIIMPYM